MRYRNRSTILGTSPKTQTDLITGVQTSDGTNAALVDSESHFWDTVGGGNKVTKPCTHLNWLLESIIPRSVVDTSDMSNAPNPRTRRDGRVDLPYASYRPSAIYGSAAAFIPVTETSSDALGKCVFDAYNKFITGVTALNSSVSIAELGETPNLFGLWQRRLSAPHNIVNGFLNYSFGWRPIYSDLVAIKRELKTFPMTVRKRLKAIGNGEVVRHFKFRLNDTVDDLAVTYASGVDGPYDWCRYNRSVLTRSKSRVVVVTIRANVKPKLGPEAQAILDKLGAAGAIPSLATLWSITRLSFVVDWFYNIGGAIENLQGCLTHDVSNVQVCVSDLRERKLAFKWEDLGGNPYEYAVVNQRYYARSNAVVPFLPSLTYPRRIMPYVLLGALGLVQTKLGGKILNLGNTKLGTKILAKVPKLNIPDLNIGALRNRLLRDRAFRKKVFGNKIGRLSR